MAEELLGRTRREIRERKAASRAAYEETKRLEAALVALDHGASGQPRRRRRRLARAARSVGVGVRAPRGENLRRIRAAIEQRPGARAGDVAAATGIARATVASTLAKLARDGELEKLTLPGGGVGYRHTRISKSVRARLPEPARTRTRLNTERRAASAMVQERRVAVSTSRGWAWAGARLAARPTHGAHSVLLKRMDPASDYSVAWMRAVIAPPLLLHPSSGEGAGSTHRS